MSISRREFMGSSLALTTFSLATWHDTNVCCADTSSKTSAAKMRFGLVTYQWGADWDLPTLIGNCQKAGAEGVELRTEHAHKVEPKLSANERKEVKARLADCPVTLVGLGTNEDYHHADQERVRKNIEKSKAFIKLSHDIGGSGVKVKPNDLPKSVPEEKTIEQIGRSLNELGAFAADYGQQVRLEVHGEKTSPLPIIAAIMAVADHPNVAVCWNSNQADLKGKGIESNFHLVEKRLGATTHVHDLGGRDYPFTTLFQLLKKANYAGWILAEESRTVDDRVAALAQERALFDKLTKM